MALLYGHAWRTTAQKWRFLARAVCPTNWQLEDLDHARPLVAQVVEGPFDELRNARVVLGLVLLPRPGTAVSSR